ncbi:radical SAM protein [Marinitoga sp. 1135]|nr:radical SAM protein [Marinitoga sp. 1135]
MIKTNKGAILKRVGGSNLIFLSQTEALFLSLCDGTKTFEDISEKISNLYEVSIDIVKNDLHILIDKFNKINIINFLPQKLHKRLSKYTENEYLFIPEIDSPIIIPHKINSIGFSLTDYCPLNCNYCFGNFNSNNTKKYLPTEKVISIIEEAEELGKVEYVSLSGGDPIAHSGLAKIINFLEKKRINYEVSTKGTILSKEKIIELVDAGLRNIQISIDAWEPEKWSRITGLKKEDFNKVIEAFYWCNVFNIKTRGRITLSKENLNDLEILFQKLPFLGVEEIRVVPILPIGRGILSQTLTENEIKYAISLKEKYEKIYNGSIKITYGLQKFAKNITCGGAKVAMQICSDGEVILCDVVEGINKSAFSYGNIFEKSIKDIWFSEKANRFRYNLDLKECIQCDKFSTCNGGCRAVAYKYYGDINKHDPRCLNYSEKKEGELFIWKKEEMTTN